MNSYRASPFANIPPVVKNLLIINIIFFIAMHLFANNGEYPLVQYLAVYYFDSPNFRIWQVITYMFMHSPGSFTHILFNMFALYSFGPALEYIMGSKKFLNFYLITGLGAMALQMVVQAIEVYSLTGSVTIDPNLINSQTLAGIYYGPMLGASGAIFGLLIGFGMLFPNAELMLLFLPIPIKAKYLMPIYIVVELFLGVAQVAGDSVAHFAHIGGALFGFILIRYWGIRRRPGGYL